MYVLRQIAVFKNGNLIANIVGNAAFTVSVPWAVKRAIEDFINKKTSVCKYTSLNQDVYTWEWKDGQFSCK